MAMTTRELELVEATARLAQKDVINALAEVYREHAVSAPQKAQGACAVAAKLGLTNELRKELGLS